MGIFSLKRVSINDPSTSFSEFLDSQLTGGTVTQKTALTLPAYYAANNIIAESIAQIPLNVFKRTDSGREIARDHPLQRLLHTEPNLLQTSFVWRHTMSIHATSGGNGLARIIRNRGQVDSLIHIDSAEFKRVDITKAGTPIYVFQGNGSEYEIKGRDLLHIPNYSPNGIIGMGWLDAARESIEGGLAQQEYSNAVHKNSGNLSGILTTDKKIDSDSATRIRQEFNSKYTGAHNTGKVAVLGNDMKFQRLPITLEEAQLLQSKSFTVEEISRVSRIPLHLLSNLQNATFSNIEQQSLEYVTYALLPWIKKWEMELDRKLLSESEKGEYQIKFNLDALQRADIDSRGKYYTAMLNTGTFTRNEVRELENFNKVDGLDEPLQPMNFKQTNEKKDESK